MSRIIPLEEICSAGDLKTTGPHIVVRRNTAHLYGQIVVIEFEPFSAVSGRSSGLASRNSLFLIAMVKYELVALIHHSSLEFASFCF